MYGVHTQVHFTLRHWLSVGGEHHLLSRSFFGQHPCPSHPEKLSPWLDQPCCVFPRWTVHPQGFAGAERHADHSYVTSSTPRSKAAHILMWRSWKKCDLMLTVTLDEPGSDGSGYNNLQLFRWLDSCILCGKQYQFHYPWPNYSQCEIEFLDYRLCGGRAQTS